MTHDKPPTSLESLVEPMVESLRDFLGDMVQNLRENGLRDQPQDGPIAKLHRIIEDSLRTAPAGLIMAVYTAAMKRQFSTIDKVTSSEGT